MTIPENLKYTETHEWIRLDGDIATIGVTEHAYEQLGELVFVEVPEVGATFEAAKPAAVVESVKAASDVYAPIDGEVTEVNEALDAAPETVNESPYDQGWLFRLKVSDAAQVEALMSADAYKQANGL